MALDPSMHQQTRVRPTLWWVPMEARQNGLTDPPQGI